MDETLKAEFQRLNTKLDRIYHLVQVVQQTEDLMATDLTTLETQVRANTDAEQSAVLLLTQLSDLIKAAAADPVKLAALADQLKGSATSLAAAVVSNTPAATPGNTLGGNTPAPLSPPKKP